MRDFTPTKGFSLLELLITVAMIGILVAVALPSFMDTLGRMSTESAVKSLNNTLNFARGEAITRGREISICASSNPFAASPDCSAASWSNGWIVFIDNNNDVTGAAGSIDLSSPSAATDDEVIQVYEPLADVTLTSASNLIQYNSRGFGLNTALINFKFCPEDNNNENARALEVGLSGRARVADGALSCP